MTRFGLSCRDAVELMTAYLEGSLRGGPRRKLERHLRQCPHCSTYLAQIRTVIDTVGRVQPADLDPEVRSGVLELYRTFLNDPTEPS